MEIHLYIAGAGGHGRELHAYLEDLRRSGWTGRLCGYVDDALTPGLYGRLQVLGPVEMLRDKPQARYITAFGNNAVRRKVVEKIGSLAPWILIHPSAHVGDDVQIGGGTCIAPAAVVTTKVEIGAHCILNVKASVSHDCVLGNYVNINPGATVCGSVTIGDGAYIGAGAVVKENVRIGAWSVIGAGAVVVRDIPPNVTAVGVPARVIKTHS